MPNGEIAPKGFIVGRCCYLFNKCIFTEADYFLATQESEASPSPSLLQKEHDLPHATLLDIVPL